MWRLKTMALKGLLVIAVFGVIGMACRFAAAGTPEPSRSNFGGGCSCCLR